MKTESPGFRGGRSLASGVCCHFHAAFHLSGVPSVSVWPGQGAVD